MTLVIRPRSFPRNRWECRTVSTNSLGFGSGYGMIDGWMERIECRARIIRWMLCGEKKGEGGEGVLCCAGRRSCGIEIAWAQHWAVNVSVLGFWAVVTSGKRCNRLTVYISQHCTRNDYERCCGWSGAKGSVSQKVCKGQVCRFFSILLWRNKSCLYTSTPW